MISMNSWDRLNRIFPQAGYYMCVEGNLKKVFGPYPPSTMAKWWEAVLRNRYGSLLTVKFLLRSPKETVYPDYNEVFDVTRPSPETIRINGWKLALGEDLTLFGEKGIFNRRFIAAVLPALFKQPINIQLNEFEEHFGFQTDHVRFLRKWVEHRQESFQSN